MIVHLIRLRYMVQLDPSAANLGRCDVKSPAVMVASGVGGKLWFGLTEGRADLVMCGRGL